MGSSMLEISGGLALVWFIVLLVEVFVKFVAPYSWAPSESARVNFVRTHEVRVQLKKHRGPESFVARAKLERQLIALEKEGAVMKDERNALKARYETMVTRAKYALYTLVVAWHWSSPLLVVPSTWTFWPLGWLLAFPGHSKGAVGALAGVLVAQLGAARVLQCIPTRGR